MAPDLLRIRCLWLLPLLAGCAGVPPRVESHVPPDTVRGIVVVADGAGAWQTASKAVAAMTDTQHLPIFVSSFDWECRQRYVLMYTVGFIRSGL